MTFSMHAQMGQKKPSIRREFVSRLCSWRAWCDRSCAKNVLNRLSSRMHQAAVEKMRIEQGTDAVEHIDVCCGLSLGEYTALAFAGAMDFEDGVRLVQVCSVERTGLQ